MVSRRNPRLWVVAAVAAAVLFLPSGALALSTTIGFTDTFTGNDPFAAPATFVQVSTGPTSPQYVVPVGGKKITAWQMQGNTISGPAQVELKVFRKTDTFGTYTVIGQSATETVAPTVLNTFRTNIHVRAGDVIGVTHVSGLDDPIFGAGWAAGDIAAEGDGNPASGSLFSAPVVSPSGFRLNLAAVVQLRPHPDDLQPGP